MMVTDSIRSLQLWASKVFCFFCGCWLCFFLQSHFHFNSVLAAATIGFLGTFIPQIRRLDHVHIQATVYTGTFVAMGSMIEHATPWQILLLSMIGTTLYFVLDRHFKGLGGKMGAIAFITTLLGLLLRSFD